MSGKAADEGMKIGVNLEFVRTVVGKSRIASGAVVCRTPKSYALSNGFRALPVADIG